MVEVVITGLRDVMGRFASLADVGVRAIQQEEAEATVEALVDVYRSYAPKSRGHTESGRHFAEGITGAAVATTAGFELYIDTDNPDLRGWLRTGTGIYGPSGQRIRPKRAQALGPIFNWLPMGTGPFWFRSVAGMPPNPWEDRAREEALPFAEAMGARIGVRMAEYLTTGV